MGRGRPGGNPDRPKLPPGKGRVKGSKNKLTKERVEKELRFIALSDPIALFDRVAKGRRLFRLREIQEMSEDMRRCIASLKVLTTKTPAANGKPAGDDTTVEVKLWSKTAALELCARILGMLNNKVDLGGTVEHVNRIIYEHHDT